MEASPKMCGTPSLACACACACGRRERRTITRCSRSLPYAVSCWCVMHQMLSSASDLLIPPSQGLLLFAAIAAIVQFATKLQAALLSPVTVTLEDFESLQPVSHMGSCMGLHAGLVRANYELHRHMLVNRCTASPHARSQRQRPLRDCVVSLSTSPHAPDSRDHPPSMTRPPSHSAS